MSTRSEVHIYGKTSEPFIRLYHHFDGYPEGVGCFLMETIYPKLMSSNTNTAEDIAQFLVFHAYYEDFEYSDRPHGDIEYLYEINVPAKTIKCFRGHYAIIEVDWELTEPPRFFKYHEYDLKTKFLPFDRRVKYA